MSLEGKSHLFLLLLFYLIIVHISRDIFNLSVWMYGWAGTWSSGCGRWRQLEHRLFGTRPSSLSSSAAGSRVAGSPPGDDFFISRLFFGMLFTVSLHIASQFTVSSSAPSAAPCPIRPMHMFLHFISFR